jgi:hypothetical protein
MEQIYIKLQKESDAAPDVARYPARESLSIIYT